MNRPPLLNVSNLSVAFATRSGTVRALEHVNLSLDRGEALAVVGESGSGKSVLAYTVMGILDRAGRVSEGSISFGGVPLLEITASQLDQLRGREMAIIFQNPRQALNPIRTVGRHLEDVLAWHAALPRKELKQQALAALAQVEITDPERRYRAYPFELSGGMCQRVMIAMALACRPQLMIADEPTTGLDVTTQAAIMSLIRVLSEETQMAMLLITHDLALAAETCDRVAVMHAGHVVETASVVELFREPRHPYTAGLIRASADALAPIPGAIPDLLSPLPVCRFSPRCERVGSECREAFAAVEVAPGHTVYCARPL